MRISQKKKGLCVLWEREREEEKEEGGEKKEGSGEKTASLSSCTQEMPGVN